MLQIDREELKRKLVESIEEGGKAMSRSLDKIARAMDSFASSIAEMAEVMASTQQRYMPMGNSYNMPMGINHQPMRNKHNFPMGNMPLRETIQICHWKTTMICMLNSIPHLMQTAKTLIRFYNT